MPRPGGMRVADKSKDFKGSMLRLFNNLDKWRNLLIICMILALISAILSTIAPNRLSGVTNVISDGIKPNTENIKLISEKIYGNAIQKYILSNTGIVDYQTKESEQADIKNIAIQFNSLPDEQKRLYLEDIEFNGTTITIDDELAFINVVSSMNETMVTEDLLSKLDNLPSSIKKHIEPKLNMQELKNKSLVLAIIYLASSIFSFIQGILMAYISNGYSKKLRSNISLKINKLPLKYFDSHETGDVLSRVTNDVDSIGMNMNQSLTTLVSSITLFLGSIVMMFVTNWIMAFTAIFASIFGFIFSFILLKRSQKYFVQRQVELGNLNGHIEEIYSGHNVVKTCNGEASALEEFDKINDKLYTCNRKSQFLSGIMQPIMGFIGNFGYVAVCVVGALLVMNDKTSFGTIVAFMIYVRLFTNPLSQIAQALTSLQSTAAAAERVFEFMDENELKDESKLKEYLAKDKVKGNIEFKNVKFGYDKDKIIIKDFNAKVKSGQKIAIVGPTGA